MIERTNAFKVGDKSFLTLADAQKHELQTLISSQQYPDGFTVGDVVEWVASNKSKILDILTTTATSKPKARKINGGTKVRKAHLEGRTETIRISPFPPRHIDNVVKLPPEELKKV